MQSYRKNKLEKIEKDIEKLYIKRAQILEKYNKLKDELDEIDGRLIDLRSTYQVVNGEKQIIKKRNNNRKKSSKARFMARYQNRKSENPREDDDEYEPQHPDLKPQHPDLTRIQNNSFSSHPGHPSIGQQSSNVPRQPSLLSVTHIPMQSLNTHPKHPSIRQPTTLKRSSNVPNKVMNQSPIKKPPKLKRNPSIPSLKYLDGFNSTAPNSTGLTRHASNLKPRKNLAYIESVIKAFQPMEVPEFSELVINICNKCEEFLRHDVISITLKKIQSKILNPSVNLNIKVLQFYMDIKKLIDDYYYVVMAPAKFGAVPPHDRIVEITNQVFPILFDIYK